MSEPTLFDGPAGGMTPGQRLRFWLTCAGVFILLLWLLRGVLLPFVAGMAAAYFLDPLADRLEAKGLSRTLATSAITLGFFALVILGLMVVVPVVEQQSLTFIERVPSYVLALRDRATPLLDELRQRMSADQIQRLQGAIGSYAGTAVGWVAGLVRDLLKGGIAVVSLLSLVFITPVVTFYLLRDWDRIVATIDGWLPRPHAATIRAEMRKIDATLAGFVRGQATVCISLASFYGLALTVCGLDLGFLIGAATGLGAFVPYVGMLVGLVTSLIMATAQGGGWPLIGAVCVVFVIGNLIEGYGLTPKLVGDRVGLHPVWIIFSLLAGGALFGFVGILLSVPTAAVIGVVTRFALQRYLTSSLYHGTEAPPES
ncbi:MAG: hypothetical protein RLZZ501_2345 [Pseudomonadota bacterium]|jgi:predicted PurR-regulated permease PerM